MVRIGLLALGGWLLAMHSALAQDWTFSEARKLPNTVNSAAEESMPLLAPDGKTLYFSRLMSNLNVGGRFGGQDIWVSRFDGTKWSRAENKGSSFRNNKKNNAVVGISRDGKTLYLFESVANQKLKGIYFSRNTNGVWSDPELIPIEGLTPEGFVGFYVSPDFDVILISMKGADSRGEEDLYVCLKEGAGWSRPRNLGTAINTTGFEISPFLTADKNRMFFTSNGHPGLGDGDIFYSDRLYNSWETWTTPKNLNTINSKAFDGYFSVQDSLGFFASNRNGQISDIYSTIVRSAVDKTQLEVKRIVEEARNLLGEISYPVDSPSIHTESASIKFSQNSVVLNSVAKRELDIVVEVLRLQGAGEITLTGFSKQQTLTNNRMRAIRDYLEKALEVVLRISQKTVSEGALDPDTIELRY